MNNTLLILLLCITSFISFVSGRIYTQGQFSQEIKECENKNYQSFLCGEGHGVYVLCAKMSQTQQEKRLCDAAYLKFKQRNYCELNIDVL